MGDTARLWYCRIQHRSRNSRTYPVALSHRTEQSHHTNLSGRFGARLVHLRQSTVLGLGWGTQRLLRYDARFGFGDLHRRRFGKSLFRHHGRTTDRARCPFAILFGIPPARKHAHHNTQTTERRDERHPNRHRIGRIASFRRHRFPATGPMRHRIHPKNQDRQSRFDLGRSGRTGALQIRPCHGSYALFLAGNPRKSHGQKQQPRQRTQRSNVDYTQRRRNNVVRPRNGPCLPAPRRTEHTRYSDRKRLHFLLFRPRRQSVVHDHQPRYHPRSIHRRQSAPAAIARRTAGPNAFRRQKRPTLGSPENRRAPALRNRPAELQELYARRRRSPARCRLRHVAGNRQPLLARHKNTRTLQSRDDSRRKTAHHTLRL